MHGGNKQVDMQSVIA